MMVSLNRTAPSLPLAASHQEDYRSHWQPMSAVEDASSPNGAEKWKSLLAASTRPSDACALAWMITTDTSESLSRHWVDFSFTLLQRTELNGRPRD